MQKMSGHMTRNKKKSQSTEIEADINRDDRINKKHSQNSYIQYAQRFKRNYQHNKKTNETYENILELLDIKILYLKQ